MERSCNYQKSEPMAESSPLSGELDNSPAHPFSATSLPPGREKL